MLTASLLAAAHAQNRPGSWQTTPCDVNGQALPYASPDNNGFYEMHGTEHWTIDQTYFSPSVISDILANPYSSYSYLSAAYPVEYLLQPYTSHSVQYGGIGSIGPSGTPLGADAKNYSQSQWWYSLGSGEDNSANILFNGSIAVDTTGQLVYYYKVQWQPGTSPTATTPMPDHINLLLRTHLSAFAGDYLFTDPIAAGILKAKATATDQVNGFGFNETASASVSESSTAPGVPPRQGQPPAPEVPEVIGYHLVRAAVNPNTKIAEVYLNGMTHWEATNTVPYGDPATEQVTNGAADAYALSSVVAGVEQVEVHLSEPDTNGNPTMGDGTNQFVYDATPPEYDASSGSVVKDGTLAIPTTSTINGVGPNEFEILKSQIEWNVTQIPPGYVHYTSKGSSYDKVYPRNEATDSDGSPLYPDENLCILMKT